MKTCYFFLSVIGLCATTYALSFTPHTTDALDLFIVFALKIILLVISIVGIIMHYEPVHSGIRRLGLFKVRRKA